MVTYYHKATGAVLTRSAQPMTGVLKRRSDEDIDILNLYRNKGDIKGKILSGMKTKEGHDPKLFIFDMRGSIAAAANVAKGGGVEDVSSYDNTELTYGNCENIHSIRSSWQLLADLVAPGSGEEEIAYLFNSRLDDTLWLKYIRQMMTVSIQIAEKIHLDASSVLVHCSDGWDRTSQACALVQLMIDPYYRTLEGIAVLIEKEWCAFGHKFQERCGHGLNHTSQTDERSPIFIQFLDCVMQIMMQFPNSSWCCFWLTMYTVGYLATSLVTMSVNVDM